MKIERAGVPEYRWGQRPQLHTHKHTLRTKPQTRRDLTPSEESYLNIDDGENWDTLLENDELDPEEAAFMRGWEDAG